MIPQEEPESVAWVKDVSNTLFSLLLLRPNHTSEYDGWMDEHVVNLAASDFTNICSIY